MPDRIGALCGETDPEAGIGHSAAKGMMRAGGAVNVGQVYRDHFAFVWRALRALGVKAPGLDDAVQEVFVIVHRRHHDFEGRASLRTWLFSIAERVAANHRRTAQRKQAPLAPLDGELVADAPDPLIHAEDAEAARFVQAFLETLDVGKRAVFVLSLIEQMPAPEVAEALGVPLNTVYSRLRVVRLAFREAARALLESSQ